MRKKVCGNGNAIEKELKDMKFMKQLSATLMSFLFQSVESAWALENDLRSSRALQRSNANEQYRRSERCRRPWIAMTTSSSLAWEAPEIVGHPDVRVRIVEADDRPLKVLDGIGPDRFTGSDGNTVQVKVNQHNRIAYRRFHEYAISYQYSSECSDFKTQDANVLRFLESLLLGGGSPAEQDR